MMRRGEEILADLSFQATIHFLPLLQFQALLCLVKNHHIHCLAPGCCEQERTKQSLKLEASSAKCLPGPDSHECAPASWWHRLEGWICRHHAVCAWEPSLPSQGTGSCGCQQRATRDQPSKKGHSKRKGSLSLLTFPAVLIFLEKGSTPLGWSQMRSQAHKNKKERKFPRRSETGEMRSSSLLGENVILQSLPRLAKADSSNSLTHHQATWPGLSFFTHLGAGRGD